MRYTQDHGNDLHMTRGPLRIGIDARELQYGMGGIARYTFQILKVLLETSHKVILFTDSPMNLNYSEADVVTIPFVKNSLLREQIVLSRAVKKARLDIFLSPYYKVPLFTPCKSILTIHDLTVLKAQLLSPLYRLYFMLMLRVFTSKAEMVFTVSESSKNDILRYTGKAGDKVKVVYNIVSDSFIPDYNATHRRYGLPDGYILYVGNLCPHKNLKVLLQAYALLGKELIEKYPVVIVGKTNGIIGRIDQNRQYVELTELSAKLGVKENIRFIECVDELDMPCIYTHAQVLVLPSVYEGFGLPLIEAMACGCPVIASNRSSIPEVTGDAAFLFEPKDYEELAHKIKLVLKDESIKNDLKAKGFIRARDFRPDKIADLITKAIESIY